MGRKRGWSLIRRRAFGQPEVSLPSWLFRLTQVTNRLWVTAALYSVLGLVAALLAALLDPLVPSDFPLKLGSDSVDDILSILASSMLAVATFSLATLVTAYTSVVGVTAPRAAELLVSDRSIRNALATFVGAFIYSIVGIVALHTNYYGAGGRVILFFFSLVVLLLVVLAMLRWIGQLSRLGQVADTVDRLAEATAKALDSRPMTLARRHGDDGPDGQGTAVRAEAVGFVQNIDIEGLEELAAKSDMRVHVAQLPGAFVHPGLPLLYVRGGEMDEEAQKALRRKVTVGQRRTFEQDPHYGFTVLGEVAARALSPGVNGPGTAREVIAATVTLLDGWAQKDGEDDAPAERVTVAACGPWPLLEAALEPVARNGADNPHLQLELQRALAALAGLGDADLAQAARQFSALALEHARRGLTRKEDIAATAKAAATVGADRAA